MPIWDDDTRCNHPINLTCRNCPEEVAHRAALRRQAHTYERGVQGLLYGPLTGRRLLGRMALVFAALAAVYGVYVLLVVAFGVQGVAG